MHPDAKTYLDQIHDDRLREALAVFFEAFDRLDRENVHLLSILQGSNSCPYGHFKANGCDLGYPGCACMDNMLAMQSWSPEDEGKAVVRIGRLLNQTRRLLSDCQDALADAAALLQQNGQWPEIARSLRNLSRSKVTDRHHAI